MEPRPAPTAAPAASRRCENCGAPLRGALCYACGQPAQSVAEIEHLRAAAAARGAQAGTPSADGPDPGAGQEAALASVEDEVRRRTAWLAARDAARTRGEAPPAYREGGGIQIDLGGQTPVRGQPPRRVSRVAL